MMMMMMMMMMTSKLTTRQTEEHEKTYILVEALPVVLRHESEGTEQRPAEVVEVRVAVVRVRTGDYARIIGRAVTARQTRPRDKISLLNSRLHFAAQCSKTRKQKYNKKLSYR